MLGLSTIFLFGLLASFVPGTLCASTQRKVITSAVARDLFRSIFPDVTDQEINGIDLGGCSAAQEAMLLEDTSQAIDMAKTAHDKLNQSPDHTQSQTSIMFSNLFVYATTEINTIDPGQDIIAGKSPNPLSFRRCCGLGLTPTKMDITRWLTQLRLVSQAVTLFGLLATRRYG